MSDAVAVVAAWIERAVVGHNLCPFAQSTIRKNSLSLVSHSATSVEDAVERLVVEAFALVSGPPEQTTIVVFEQGLDAFDDFLTVIDSAEVVFEAMELGSDVQLAHFHPNYCFSGSGEDEAANFTNRSPYPAVHLLQVHDVAEAIQNHPDTLAIPKRNIEHLSSLSKAELEDLQYGAGDGCGE